MFPYSERHAYNFSPLVVYKTETYIYRAYWIDAGAYERKYINLNSN